MVMVVMRPFSRFVSDSNEESAQTTLHVGPMMPNRSGAYFSQSSVLYRDKSAATGLAMETPTPMPRTWTPHGRP